MLTGSSEGIYSFIAANFASGALQQYAKRRAQQQSGVEPEEFLGVLELGGASLQVLLYQAWNACV